MSWMDSWSRPSKNQAVPAPFYLSQSPEQAKYCHTCGRIIGSRRSNTSKSSSSEVKFCSDRCKRSKPSTAPDSLEVRVENALLALLEGREPPKIPGGNGVGDGEGSEVAKPAPVKPANKGKKGDPRIIVLLSELETAVFGDRKDPEKKYGRRKNRAFRGIKDGEEWRSVDMIDGPKQQQQRPSPDSTALNRQSKDEETSRTDEDGDDSDDDDEGSTLSLTDSNPDYNSDSESNSNSRPTTQPSSTSADAGVPLNSSSATMFPSHTSNPAQNPTATPDMVHLHHHRPSQLSSDVNFSVGGERGWSEKISETPEMLQKRREGQKRAEEKEFVKQAARRAVVFGLLVDEEGERERVARGGGKGEGKGKGKGGKKGKGEEENAGGEGAGGKVRRKCEAVMQGAVVEPSFAKGDWQVRWRED